MRYALLIYTDENAREMPPPEAIEMKHEAYSRFGQDLGSRVVAGEELQDTSTATSVRIEGGPGGDAIVTDGPFGETKEQLAGFYVIECGDLDEAIQWAARVPGAPFGTIEVRPVVERPEPR